MQDTTAELDSERSTGSPTIPITPIVGRERPMIASALDGRYGPMHPAQLAPLIQLLLGVADLRGIDHILGIPEGGTIPAYAFAVAAGLPVALASIWEPDLPGVVTFMEEHDGSLGPKHIYGLRPGSGVLIVEDEITTGRTVRNCVRALRAAGVTCDQVATILASSDASMRSRLHEEGIRVHAAQVYPPDARQVPIGG